MAEVKDNDTDGDGAEQAPLSKTQLEKGKKIRAKARVVVQHLDIIKDDFWEKRPGILSGGVGKTIEQ